jgi:hypothetical protein
MRELRPGLWHWEAPHLQWRAGEPWGPEVSSYAIDDGERLLLFDPLALPSELEELAADREAAVVLTNPWHERDCATSWSISRSPCTRRCPIPPST